MKSTLAVKVFLVIFATLAGSVSNARTFCPGNRLGAQYTTLQRSDCRTKAFAADGETIAICDRQSPTVPFNSVFCVKKKADRWLVLGSAGTNDQAECYDTRIQERSQSIKKNGTVVRITFDNSVHKRSVLYDQSLKQLRLIDDYWGVGITPTHSEILFKCR